MGRQQFIDELKQLGYNPVILSSGGISFPFEVPIGRLAGQEITLGFMVGEDFPANPPSGPHVSPRILPMNPTPGVHPNDGIHESPGFGADWQYWSRPFSNWGETDRSVRAYMTHIRRLFDTL